MALFALGAEQGKSAYAQTRSIINDLGERLAGELR